MTKECDQLTSLLREEYNLYDAVGKIEISPEDLAQAVYKRIDPRYVSPPLVQHAAILELKQLARGICATRQLEDERNVEQGSLFDIQLQPRYPARRDNRDVYVLRAHLTLEERNENIARLRAEAEAKHAHADALQAETNMLLSQGKLFGQPVS